jgi:hypothetical protein
VHGLDLKNGHKNLLTSSPNQPWQREENAQKNLTLNFVDLLKYQLTKGWFFLALDHTFIQPLLLAKTRNFFLGFSQLPNTRQDGKERGKILNKSLLWTHKKPKAFGVSSHNFGLNSLALSLSLSLSLFSLFLSDFLEGKANWYG